MEEFDATTFGQTIQQLGLVNEAQLLEAREEAGEGNNDPGVLIRALERKGFLTPWQRDRVLRGYTDGFFLGGYRILYKIASGSFGRVFRADDPRSGRVVAIKVLRHRWSEDKQHIDQFVREGKVGLSLRHPNIVEVLAIAQDASSQQYYIVMEFVEGGNLREILAIRKKLSVPEALKIIEDGAAGLTHAYSKGITHRDIKLTNLLISATGEAKLVDFGLARLFAAAKEKVDRTVDYAGLERLTGVKPGDVRSDIYFLGCILYESLTGRPPLAPTRDRQSRMRRERFEQVPPMRADEVEGPPSVFALVETMMSLSPARRYQTPAQLLEAIKSVRREVAARAGADNGRPPLRSIFVAERNEHLQDKLRQGLKELGFRVYMAADPARALDRFRQQPYDALLVDVGTTGEDGWKVFEYVRDEAGRRRLPLAAVAMLKEEQKSWADLLKPGPQAAVLVLPVPMKQLARTLKRLFPAAPSPTP
jgi:CheY-like chemotaxis protein